MATRLSWDFSASSFSQIRICNLPLRMPKKRERWSGWLSGWASSTKQKRANERERERDIEETEWCLCVWLQSMRSPRQLCSSAPNCRQVRLKWQKKGQTERQLVSLTASEIRPITRMTVQAASYPSVWIKQAWWKHLLTPNKRTSPLKKPSSRDQILTSERYQGLLTCSLWPSVH